jgi:hypothetical protein
MYGAEVGRDVKVVVDYVDVWFSDVDEWFRMLGCGVNVGRGG